MQQVSTESAKDRLVKVFSRYKVGNIKYNRTDFSELLGYNKSHVSEVFNGKTPITVGFAAKVREKCGISEQWLLYGTGNMFVNTDNQSVNDNNVTNNKLDAPIGNNSKSVLDLNNTLSQTPTIQSLMSERNEAMALLKDAMANFTRLSESIDRVTRMNEVYFNEARDSKQDLKRRTAGS